MEAFKGLGYKEGVEIGTRAGNFSKLICDTVPGVKLHCVDPWIAYNRLGQEHQEQYYQETVNKLAPYGVDIIRLHSMAAVGRFADGSLDFAFIDGSHDFDDVILDLVCWSRKVRIGGIVAGHDYSMFPDVVYAANAYVAGHSIHPWYLVREYESTFFWVKEKNERNNSGVLHVEL